jgi:folylpolyglutamate synthase/dihydropteroate synthase
VTRFEDAVAELDRRQPEHMPEPSLDRIRVVSELMDDPQLTYQTIHVTGTNGKTTIARAAAELACAHGVKSGLFTSPHLHTVRERLSVCGVEISEDEFAEAWAHLGPYLEVADAREHGASTYFEAITALAFLWFADKPVDLAVVEVGMGGSWDATNLVAGDVAVIGEVGLDHPELGSSVQEVATEKAGIVKSGKTVVVREQPDEALKVIEARATDVGATVLLEGRDWDVTARLPAVGGQQFRVRGEHATYDELFLPMFGEHVVRNVAAAIVAVESVLGYRLDPRPPRGARSLAPDRAGRCAQPGGRGGARAGPGRGVHMVPPPRRPGRVLEQGRGRCRGRARADGGRLVSRPERERAELPRGARRGTDRRGRGGRVADLGTVEESLAAARDAAAEEDLILVTGSLYTVADARRALGGS